MSSYQVFVLIFIALLLVVLPSYGISLCFKKMGIPQWKAFVPFYNTWIMAEAMDTPKYWFFLQFVPVLGWFATMVIFIEFSKLFTKYKFYQHALAALAAPLYFVYIGMGKTFKNNYVGKEVAKRGTKSKVREWLDAAVFAIVAATLIRTFVFEAYTIPTSSMEKTLLVNDFLFVSKMKYGPRIPNTPIAMPFVHNSLPASKIPSYIEWPSIPYTRWFASPVKRNDIVVFNLPAGDTLTKERDSQDPYYDILRREEMQLIINNPRRIKDSATLYNTSYAIAREAVWQEFNITTRPVDKRENYIKRCVAIGGDEVKIVNGDLFINGAPSEFKNTTTFYTVTTNGKNLSEEDFKDVGIHLNQAENDDASNDFHFENGKIMLNLSDDEVAKAKAVPGVVSLEKNIENANYGSIPFPYCYNRVNMGWNRDNFGPLVIPKKGMQITLDANNIALYERAISVYEHNTFENKNGTILINGVAATTYTFKMDYFWMMGDNRHKSQDSRFWGYVPEDHIVGSPSVIWMSLENGIRWKRLFSVPK
jgi:signal peptidase I